MVGLGNPGEKYKNTRHNVGFLVVDRLVGEKVEWKISKSTGAQCFWLKINDFDVELFKPQNFMNKSGVAVKGVFKKHPNKFQLTKLENMWVVHDDLDIKLGEYKLSFGKGPKDHNGLKSIYGQIGTDQFWHVRIGIDNGEYRNSGEEYVLSKWKPDERVILDKVIDKIVKELRDVLARESS